MGPKVTESLRASIKKYIYIFKSTLDPFKNWAICYRYLVYTLEEDNEDSEYLFIVDLEDDNKKIKVKNFG